MNFIGRISVFAALLFALSTALSTAASAADFGFEMSNRATFTLIASVRVKNADNIRADDVVVEMFLPQNLVGQSIYSLDYLPEPAEVNVDRWGSRLGRWKLPPLEPGETAFVTFVARAASSEVKFDTDRLRRGNYPLPQLIRMLYQWDAAVHGDQQAYAEQALLLAGYVRHTVSQELSSLPFPQAIPAPESSLTLATTMTKLAHANDIPCRTVGGYAGGGSAAFVVDCTGRAWNEIYFPQSGWMPMIVSEPRDFGRKKNDCFIVRMAGNSTEEFGEFWGSVNSKAMVDVRHRAYFSRPRRTQQDRELIEMFKNISKLSEQEMVEKFAAFGPGSSLALGLLEPYLYHSNADIATAAAGAVRSIGQSSAVVMIVDAMSGSPETDAPLAAAAEALTGQELGANCDAWRTYVREKFPCAK